MRKQRVYIIAAIVAASLIGAVSSYQYVQSSPTAFAKKTDFVAGSPSKTASDLTWTGIITYQLGSNSTAINASRGSSVSGTIPLIITNASAPMRFYVDDIRYNSSIPSIPDGITVSAKVYGKQYSLESLSQVPVMDSKNPFIKTHIGATDVNYTISVAKSVAPGTYHFKILCMSFLPPRWSPPNTERIMDEGRYYYIDLAVL